MIFYVVVDNCCTNIDCKPEIVAVLSSVEKCRDVVETLNWGCNGHNAVGLGLSLDEISEDYQECLRGGIISG